MTITRYHFYTLALLGLFLTVFMAVGATTALAQEREDNTDVHTRSQVKLFERLRSDFIDPRTGLETKNDTRVQTETRRSTDPDRPVVDRLRPDVDRRADDHAEANVTNVRTTTVTGKNIPIDARTLKQHAQTFREALSDANTTDEKRAEAKARFHEAVAGHVDIANDTQVRSDRRAEVEERIEAKRRAVADQREELNETAKERVLAFIDRVALRMEAAVDRLAVLADRLESRIAKLQDRGVDMTTAIDLLDIARAELVVASDGIAAAQLAAQAQVEAATNARAAFLAATEFLREAKTSLKSAHDALVDTLRAVKAASADLSVQESDNTQADAE